MTKDEMTMQWDHDDDDEQIDFIANIPTWSHEQECVLYGRVITTSK